MPRQVLDELEPLQNRSEWTPIQGAFDAGWLECKDVVHQKTLQTLTLDLDPGEAAAIALAMELGLSTLLIDESDGRRVATGLSLRPTGVLGVLLKAKNQGRLKSVGGAMVALRTKARFFVHEELFQRVLQLAGEGPP